MFKDDSEAYNVLFDPQKQQLYGQFGEACINAGAAGAGAGNAARNMGGFGFGNGAAPGGGGDGVVPHFLGSSGVYFGDISFSGVPNSGSSSSPTTFHFCSSGSKGEVNLDLEEVFWSMMQEGVWVVAILPILLSPCLEGEWAV